VYNRLRSISDSSEKIPREITRYQTNAGLKLEYARLEVEKLHTFLAIYHEEGYALEDVTKQTEQFLFSLTRSENNLQRAEKNPDVFKEVYEFSEKMALNAKHLKENLNELFIKKRLLDESIPKMPARIQ